MFVTIYLPSSLIDFKIVRPTDDTTFLAIKIITDVVGRLYLKCSVDTRKLIF